MHVFVNRRDLGIPSLHSLISFQWCIVRISLCSAQHLIGLSMHVAAAERHAGLSLSHAGDFEGGVPWSLNFGRYSLACAVISGVPPFQLPIDPLQTEDFNSSLV